jgi:crossover junction endodeoxyribonuclease RuvC
MILGLDPGLAHTGWALVDRHGSRLLVHDCGTLTTSPRTDHVDRLVALFDAVSDILATGGVTGAAVESWFVHPVSTSAMAMAEARGALLVAVARAGVDVTEYPPTEIKLSVTGSGRADKGQIRRMVTRLTGAQPSSDHAADAVAAAICHLHRAPLTTAIRRAK